MGNDDTLKPRRRFRIASRRGLVRAGVGMLFLILLGAYMMSMPGCSYSGALPPLAEEQTALRDTLKSDLVHLAGTIGERNTLKLEAYNAAADWIDAEFAKAGYTVERQTFTADGKECHNIIVERAGSDKSEEVLVIGAHYDSVYGTAGANDNGTGTVGVLALARRFADRSPKRTVRFVAFANEEPPYFKTGKMGSRVYAKRCRAREENVVGMISLETIGHFSDEPKSQKYPPPLSFFYPSTGNFIAFVCNVRSRGFLGDVIGTFRDHVKFPSEGAALPAVLPGIGWSDHWAFWKEGYRAIMVTDTAPFRYPHYHAVTDTPDKIDYDRFARVVDGIDVVVEKLANQ